MAKPFSQSSRRVSSAPIRRAFPELQLPRKQKRACPRGASIVRYRRLSNAGIARPVALPIARTSRARRFRQRTPQKRPFQRVATSDGFRNIGPMRIVEAVDHIDVSVRGIPCIGNICYLCSHPMWIQINDVAGASVPIRKRWVKPNHQCSTEYGKDVGSSPRTPMPFAAYRLPLCLTDSISASMAACCSASPRPTAASRTR